MILHSITYPREPRRAPLAVPAPRLIFLHGLGGVGSLWRPIAAGLEDQCDLLCPDQRGHGGSIPPPTDWSFRPEDYARDIHETSAAAEFKPAWVIGHSMGVRTALGYAKLNPGAVRGLVLIDLGFTGLAGGGVGDALAEFLQILPERFANRSDARAFIVAHCPDPAIGQYLIAVSKVAEDASVTFPFNHAALRATVEAAKGYEGFADLETFAHETGRPVYVLRGEKSLVYSSSDFQADRERATHLPEIRWVEFANAGHGLPFEQRAEFLRKLREWIGIAPLHTP